MSNVTQLTTTREEKAVEFMPFGAADKIKLTVNIVKNLIAVKTRTGKTCNDQDAMKFVMLCQAQRLNPFAGDAFLVGYDSQDGPTFSLITAHQAFLKRAETCKEYEGMDSGIILLDGDGTVKEREGDFHLPDETVVGGWARVHRQGRKPTYRRLRMDRFNKGFAQWKVDPAGMIVKCAEADALRSTFPTLLGGLYTEGEVLDITATVTAGPPKPTFEVPAIADTPTNTQKPEPQAEEAPEPEKVKDKPKQNFAKAIKGLLVLAGVSEVELMDYLRSTGQIEDSIGTLAEMDKVAGVTLEKVHNDWSAPKGPLAEIKRLKEAKAA